MSFIKRYRLSRRIALGLVFAAIAAPASQASIAGVGGGGPLPGDVIVGKAVSTYPDQRGNQGVPNSAAPTIVQPFAAPVSGGFDWGDAGIGAAIALGVTGAGVLAGKTSRRLTLAS